MKKIWNGLKIAGGIYLLCGIIFIMATAVQSCTEILNEPIETETAQNVATDSISTLYESENTTETEEEIHLVSGTCNALTKRGTPCRNRVKAGEYYCWRHK